MTAARIEPQKVSAQSSVLVQAQFNGVNLTEAQGGVFSAPVVNQGSVTLISWMFSFPTFVNAVSATFKLLVPDLSFFPDQRTVWCNYAGSRFEAILQAGVITVSTNFTLTTSLVHIMGMLTPTKLN